MLLYLLRPYWVARVKKVLQSVMQPRKRGHNPRKAAGKYPALGMPGEDERLHVFEKRVREGTE